MVCMSMVGVETIASHVVTWNFPFHHATWLLDDSESPRRITASLIGFTADFLIKPCNLLLPTPLRMLYREPVFRARRSRQFPS